MKIEKFGIGTRKKTIKFKAWDRFTKKMWNWDEHNAFGDYKGSIKDWFTDHDLIQLQYTGFKDIKNKEIYEGDIVVDIDDERLDRPKERRVMYVVTFVKDIGLFDLYAAEVPLFEHKNLEIIGNVFQNKNLIKYVEVCTNDLIKK